MFSGDCLVPNCRRHTPLDLDAELRALLEQGHSE